MSLLTDMYGQSIGVYRDDGLAAFNKTPKEIEKIKKELCKIFREDDLKITIEANKTIINFLDVTLDLQSGKHYSYTKEGIYRPIVRAQEIQSPTIYPEKHPRFHQQTAFRNIVVYAPNYVPERDNFFSDVASRVDPSVPTVIVGDFNTV